MSKRNIFNACDARAEMQKIFSYSFYVTTKPILKEPNPTKYYFSGTFKSKLNIEYSCKALHSRISLSETILSDSVRAVLHWQTSATLALRTNNQFRVIERKLIFTRNISIFIFEPLLFIIYYQFYYYMRRIERTINSNCCCDLCFGVQVERVFF